MSLFQELKRRNVFRVGAAYLVVAWLLIQAADIMLANFGAPDWVFKSVVTLLLIGFPLALFLAWAYEMTPEGVRRSDEVTAADAAATGARRPFDWIIVAGLMVIIALMAAERWWVTKAPGPIEPVAAIIEPSAAAKKAPGEADAEALAPGIGVLPFGNLSPDPENAFFASGIHEEVLTHLARMPGLRVISRTSMLRVAESDLDIRDIGERLGVTHVLEGSVRRAGDRVRVSVQLIDARNHEHVWAENYERDLLDVFAIQSEIALAVARQLRLNLALEVSAQINERPTPSQAAYDLYLQARTLPVSYDEARMRNAIQLLRAALQADPEFALAMGELGLEYARLFHHVTRNPPDCELSRYWIDQAMAREPGNPSLQFQLGEHLYRCHLDFDSALTQLALAEQGLPGRAEIYALRGFILRRAGRLLESIEALDKAIARDPRAEELLHNQVESYGLLGDLENARRVDRLLDDTPRSLSLSRLRLPEVEMNVAGDLRAMTASLAAEPKESVDAQLFSVALHYLQRDWVNARLALARLDEDFLETQFRVFSRPLWLARIAMAENDRERSASYAQAALQQFERALARRPDDYRVLSAKALALALLGDARGTRDNVQRALAHPMVIRDAMIRAVIRAEELLALAHLAESGELAAAVEEYLRLEMKLLHADGLMIYPEMDRHRDHPGIRRLAQHQVPGSRLAGGATLGEE